MHLPLFYPSIIVYPVEPKFEKDIRDKSSGQDLTGRRKV